MMQRALGPGSSTPPGDWVGPTEPMTAADTEEAG